MIKALGSVENCKNLDIPDNQVSDKKNVQDDNLSEILAGNISDKNSAATEVHDNFNSTAITIGVSIAAAVGLAVLFRGKIKSLFKPAKVAVQTAQKTSPQTPFDIFLEKFINMDYKARRAMEKFDFSQYGKNGIPIKYPRKNFITDIKNTIKDLPVSKQESILKDFNLKFGVDDLDGIARISSKNSPVHKKINSIIDTFYNNNECLIQDTEVKKLVDYIRNAFPEFNMIIGKVQHDTHAYSVDIHTLKTLQNCYKNTASRFISGESQVVMTISAILHDFGKVGNIRHPGHAAVSAIEAETILKRLPLSQKVKDRIINQIENHHWFEWFNKGITGVPDLDIKLNAEKLLRIFDNNQDLNVAKILAKADLESVNPVFHRYIMGNGKLISQEEFEKRFWNKVIYDIPNHEYQDVIDNMVAQRKYFTLNAAGVADSINNNYLYANKGIKRYFLKDIAYNSNEAFSESILENIPFYDQVIEQGFIPRNISLYRGGTANDYGYSKMRAKDFLDRFYKKGRVFRMPCYLETSLDKEIGMHFAKMHNDEFTNAILYKFNVPKLTPGIFLERTGNSSTYIYDIEQEILLPRDLIGRFKSRQFVDGVEVVEIDILDRAPLFKKVHEFWKNSSAQKFYKDFVEKHFAWMAKPAY